MDSFVVLLGRFSRVLDVGLFAVLGGISLLCLPSPSPVVFAGFWLAGVRGLLASLFLLCHEDQ